MRILSVIRKEMLEVAHDRTMLAVLLVFPVFVMLFMGYSFRSLEISGLPIGVSGQLNTTFSEVLLGGLNNSSAFNLKSFDFEDDAMTAFRDGQLRAVIVIPDDFEESLKKGGGATIRVVVDNSDIALEQSVLAAMGAVIKASSANITVSYVSGAWGQLQKLNESAAALAEGVSGSRTKMEATKATLGDIRTEIDGINIDSLEGSLNDSQSSIASLQTLLSEQKAQLANLSEANSMLLNESDLFLANASGALNESIDTVGSTHEKLEGQAVSLNNTIQALDASITGLEQIRDNTNDTATKAALNFNIAALESLRNTTESQREDTLDQMSDLEDLNETLFDFRDSLENYQDRLAEARGREGTISDMESVLDNVSGTLERLDGSFASAQGEVSKLRKLLGEIKETSVEIEATLDDAISQTSSVDTLISSLQETVAEQTARDPQIIASPLSVKIENQYERGSFVDFMMPQIISVSLLFSCFLLGSISLVREKTRSTIVRALMIPGGLASLVSGKIISLVLLSFGQVLVILLVAMGVYGVRPPENIPMLILGTLVSSLVLSSIGVVVGFYAKRESAAIQTCLLLAIPMLFLGNIIFSPDLLPQFTQVLQQIMPLAHVTSIFKIIMITNGNPLVDMTALVTYFIVLSGLLAFFVINRKDITNYV
ncbi:MAG TPA: ABC transporter permease [Candidatus Bilamarchaeum sp.]|nr:ABC transporter permease [Candidatus Bilamarchaeum sp.]